MRLLCFNELDLILRRSPTGRANARPMTGSVAVSKDGPQYRFVIPGTRRDARLPENTRRFRGNGPLPMTTDLSNETDAPIRYAYKASLIGAAHQFELTDH